MRAQKLSAMTNDGLNGQEIPGRRALALAGGSDRPPPGQGGESAEIIRFPVERVRPATPDPEGTPPAIDAPPPADAISTDAGAVWAGWMTGVLSGKPIAVGPQATIF